MVALSARGVSAALARRRAVRLAASKHALLAPLNISDHGIIGH